MSGVHRSKPGEAWECGRLARRSSPQRVALTLGKSKPGRSLMLPIRGQQAHDIGHGMAAADAHARQLEAVSYTHLTLPTSDLV